MLCPVGCRLYHPDTPHHTLTKMFCVCYNSYDSLHARRYSTADLSGKAVCKRALQREFRLPPEPDVPVIGFIGRLDYQKGPDLVLDALPFLTNLDCQVCLKVWV